MLEITKNYDNSNVYYLINEEEVTKSFKEAIKYLKNGAKVEISNEISWGIQEFEDFYYHNSELLHKDEYTLTYDNEVVDNDSAVYCEDVEDYMHCDNVFYLENEGVYYSDDTELTYSDLEGTYIHDNNVAYVIDAQGHEQPVHADNLDNYYFDEDEAQELRIHGGDKGEFGATTGRPRRVGWFDCVATRYGVACQEIGRASCRERVSSPV